VDGTCAAQGTTLQQVRNQVRNKSISTSPQKRKFHEFKRQKVQGIEPTAAPLSLSIPLVQAICSRPDLAHGKHYGQRRSRRPQHRSLLRLAVPNAHERGQRHYLSPPLDPRARTPAILRGDPGPRLEPRTQTHPGHFSPDDPVGTHPNGHLPRCLLDSPMQPHRMVCPRRTAHFQPRSSPIRQLPYPLIPTVPSLRNRTPFQMPRSAVYCRTDARYADVGHFLRKHPPRPILDWLDSQSLTALAGSHLSPVFI
jgi:hypothetical protein